MHKLYFSILIIMKTIVLCGSMKLIGDILRIGDELTSLGFSVLLPNMSETSDYSSMTKSKQFDFKERMIEDHLNKVRTGDAILVVNKRLKNVDGYIGANTFLEMGFAFCLKKKIFILNEIPDQPNKIEIGGMKPDCLGGDLKMLKRF